MQRPAKCCHSLTSLVATRVGRQGCVALNASRPAEPFSRNAAASADRPAQTVPVCVLDRRDRNNVTKQRVVFTVARLFRRYLWSVFSGLGINDRSYLTYCNTTTFCPLSSLPMLHPCLQTKKCTTSQELLKRNPCKGNVLGCTF